MTSRTSESELQRRVTQHMGSVESTSPDSSTDEAFNTLALDVFAHQYEHIEAVHRFAEITGRIPGTVSHWRDIPLLPARAFKRYPLFSGRTPEHTFRSSGTSGAARSEAHFSRAGLELMAESIAHNARRFLLPDGRSTVILVLAPSPELAPEMIMAWGMNHLIEQFGLPGSRFLVTGDGLDRSALMEVLQRCVSEGTPVTLIGASFGFVHLFDGLRAGNISLSLPEGSRLMDAGGFKGRSRTLLREELDAVIFERLGIPAHRSVNLLGMTELASQFYDSVMERGLSTPRVKVNAAWTRTEVLDPRTLKPAPSGSKGLLAHWDLANIERPMAILTDDLGVREEAGWHVLGRAAGAESKGCSLTIDDMLRGRAA